MRLLAHGGNEYAERRRIGSWPAIATGPLEDTYGLSGDWLSFGLGLLESDPVLVIRQAQKQGQRLYAYSLLLDPGHAVWERFQWNAASFVLALFGGVEPSESAPDCFGRQLLDRPEEIDEAKLFSILEALPIPRIIPARDAVDLLSIWVGAIYSSEPVTIAPQSLGMESRPGVAQLAAILQALQPSLRAGRGWLVGGSSIHSETFGAHLVLDDWLTKEAPPIQEHIENGKWIISAWETLARLENYKRIVNEKLETPIWEWDELWRKSPAKSFERVYCLAQALGTNLQDEEIVNVIQNDLDGEGPLERDIREAVHQRVASRHGPLSRNLSLFLLRDHFDKGLMVDDATAERLDEATVVEFYTDALRRISPTAERGSPLLLVPVRFQIWLTLISTEETAVTIPGLLRRACDDLRPDGSSWGRIAEIVEAALSRSLTLTESLEMWIAHRRDKVVGPLIREPLRNESRQRALKQSDNWPRDYLAFGQDPGGADFVRHDFPVKTMQKLVAEIGRLSNSGDGLMQDALTWLSDLAGSPLRLKLPIEDKVALQEALSAGWENFHAMLALYAGNQATAIEAVQPSSEREVLIGELTKLTAVRFSNKPVPNLRGLIGFLGHLPDETVSAFASLRPSLSGPDITGWMEGWEKLRPEDVYQDELIRQVMQSEKRFEIPTLLKKLGNEKQVELFRQLLFGESAQPDEEIFKRFARFVEYAVKDSSLADEIETAFKDCEMNHSKRDTFFRRHCDRASFLNELFKCLHGDSQLRVISIIFKRNFQRIEGDACRHYTNSEKANFILTPYNRAVFRFVLSADGGRLREAIANNGTGRLSLVESRLKDVLRSSAVEGEPVLEREEKKPWWKRAFFE